MLKETETKETIDFLSLVTFHLGLHLYVGLCRVTFKLKRLLRFGNNTEKFHQHGPICA